MKNKWKNSGYKMLTDDAAKDKRPLRRRRRIPPKEAKRAEVQLRQERLFDTANALQNRTAARGQIRNANSRTIFKDPTLSSQFLRNYSGCELFKDITEEDVEDVSGKYQAYLGIEFESDTVKRIRMKDEQDVFLVSLIEHKSDVDYDVSMQFFRYMLCIWTDYAREQEKKQKGISKTKAFRYPPVIPILYYEGAANWTASLQLKDRIAMSELLNEFLPDFKYRVVSIHDYSNEELLAHEDEISLLMMINKVQTPEEMERFLAIGQDRIGAILKKASPHVLEIVASTIWSLCMKMDMSNERAEDCVKYVKERNMGYLFESMQKWNVREQVEQKFEELREEVERQALEDVSQRVEEMERQAQQRVEEMERQAQEDMSRRVSEMENQAQQRVEEMENQAQHRVEEMENQAQHRVEEMENQAQRHVEEMERLAQEKVVDAAKQAQERLADADQQAQERLADADQQAQERLADADQQVAEMFEEAQRKTVCAFKQCGMAFDEVVAYLAESWNLHGEEANRIVARFWNA